MKRLMAIGAAAAVSAGASAQDAVQWRVEVGGNGHWSALRADSVGFSWSEARVRARLEGGDLASLGQVGCEALVRSLLNNTVCGGSTSQAGPYVGGYQDRLAPDYLEPSGGWRWVDGSAFPGSASVSSDNDQGNQDYLHFISANGGCLGPWIIDDVALQTENRSYIIEWSADCNADGLVDFGQIRSGELSDANANNIPDCCEAATECPNPLAPVEWRVADGGNGHWYGLRVDPLASLDDFDSSCARIGGHLVSLGSAQEHQFVVDLMIAQDWLARIGWPAIGLRRTSSTSPWRWSTGEPLEYLAWAPGEPSDAGLFAQLWGTASGPNLTWSSNGNPFVSTGVIEFSADCNADGLVDYGQIRSGELSDTNANNIPDCCENGTPCGCAGDTNLDGTIDGIDLATVLTRWAQSAAKFPNADCNRDGVIDGSDLATVLGSWGACP